MKNDKITTGQEGGPDQARRTKIDQKDQIRLAGPEGPKLIKGGPKGPKLIRRRTERTKIDQEDQKDLN